MPVASRRTRRHLRGRPPRRAPPAGRPTTSPIPSPVKSSRYSAVAWSPSDDAVEITTTLPGLALGELARTGRGSTLSRSLSSAPPITMTGPAVRSPSAWSEPSSVMGKCSLAAPRRQIRLDDRTSLATDGIGARHARGPRTTPSGPPTLVTRDRDRAARAGRRAGRPCPHAELPRVRRPVAERPGRAARDARAHAARAAAAARGAYGSDRAERGHAGRDPGARGRARASGRDVARGGPPRAAPGPGPLGVLRAGRRGPRPRVGRRRAPGACSRAPPCSRTS